MLLTSATKPPVLWLFLTLTTVLSLSFSSTIEEEIFEHFFLGDTTGYCKKEGPYQYY